MATMIKCNCCGKLFDPTKVKTYNVQIDENYGYRRRNGNIAYIPTDLNGPFPTRWYDVCEKCAGYLHDLIEEGEDPFYPDEYEYDYEEVSFNDSGMSTNGDFVVIHGKKLYLNLYQIFKAGFDFANETCIKTCDELMKMDCIPTRSKSEDIIRKVCNIPFGPDYPDSDTDGDDI